MHSYALQNNIVHIHRVLTFLSSTGAPATRIELESTRIPSGDMPSNANWIRLTCTHRIPSDKIRSFLFPLLERGNQLQSAGTHAPGGSGRRALATATRRPQAAAWSARLWCPPPRRCSVPAAAARDRAAGTGPARGKRRDTNYTTVIEITSAEWAVSVLLFVRVSSQFYD